MCLTQSDRYCAHTYEYKDIYYIFDVHPIFWGTCRLSCLALTSEAARGDTNAAANQLYRPEKIILSARVAEGLSTVPLLQFGQWANLLGFVGAKMPR